MEPKDYSVRCDKCQFKPYVYCEMCMIRTQLQNAIEINRETVKSACASIKLSINVINDILNAHELMITYALKILSGK